MPTAAVHCTVLGLSLPTITTLLAKNKELCRRLLIVSRYYFSFLSVCVRHRSLSVKGQFESLSHNLSTNLSRVPQAPSWEVYHQLGSLPQHVQLNYKTIFMHKSPNYVIHVVLQNQNVNWSIQYRRRPICTFCTLVIFREKVVLVEKLFTVARVAKAWPMNCLFVQLFIYCNISKLQTLALYPLAMCQT